MSSSDSDTPEKLKRYKCTIKGCNAAFSKNNKLTYHIRKHTGERPFACNESGCTKTYTNSSHLRRHKKVSHGEKKATDSFICEYEGCGVVCANKYSLKKHYVNKHNPDMYTFKCAECNQGFHKKRQLQQHSYLHTGQAPFSCDLCDLTFTAVGRFNQHKRSHKSYTCDCGEVFHRWSLLLAHRKEGCKTKFECHICQKQFTQKINLATHTKTHMDKDQKLVYVCPYPDCKRFYFYKKNVKFHVNKFHKRIDVNLRLKCTYPKCTVVLSTKPSLRMHLQRHFNWVPKKKRKERKDKGIPKKPIVSLLCGIDTSLQSDKCPADEVTLLEACSTASTSLEDQAAKGGQISDAALMSLSKQIVAAI